MSAEDLPPLILATADPEPVVGAQVVDHEGLTWERQFEGYWLRLDSLDGDPESWVKVAGNYGPVTLVGSDWVNWLLGRIAEDEQQARAATTFHADSWSCPSTGVVDTGASGLDGLLPTGDRELAEHIARWDPDRVLAECGAKRRVVAEYQYWHRKLLTNPDYPALADRYEGAATMLRALTTAYAAHPGCRPEWVP